MKLKGTVFGELDAAKYTEIAGQLRKKTPKHLYIGIERNLEKGKIKLWSMQPKTAKRVLAGVLGQKVPEGCKFPGMEKYIHEKTKPVKLIKPKLVK